MLPQDLTVEVRDRNLARVGQILPKDMIGQFRIADSAVGDWQLTLRADHPMGPALRTPGAGIIVTGPSGVLLSGPMVSADLDVNQGDLIGTLTVKGVTDEIVLWDTLAYPQPDWDGSIPNMSIDYDLFTGLGIDAMSHFLFGGGLGWTGGPTTFGNMDRWPAGSLGAFLTFNDLTGGGGSVNLIPNPGPTPAGYADQPTTQGDLYPATDTMPNSETPTWWYEGITVTAYHGIQYHTYFPHGAAIYWSIEIIPGTPAGNWRVFPVLSGTSAIPVTPGTAYSLSGNVNCQSPGGARMGVRWYDAAGATLSDATAATFTTLPNQQDTGVGWDSLSTSGGGTTIVPDDTSYIGYVGQATPATLTAPTGAAYAAPYVECNSAMNNTTYISNLSMVQA